MSIYMCLFVYRANYVYTCERSSVLESGDTLVTAMTGSGH